MKWNSHAHHIAFENNLIFIYSDNVKDYYVLMLFLFLFFFSELYISTSAVNICYFYSNICHEQDVAPEVFISSSQVILLGCSWVPDFHCLPEKFWEVLQNLLRSLLLALCRFKSHLLDPFCKSVFWGINNKLQALIGTNKRPGERCRNWKTVRNQKHLKLDTLDC